MASARDRVRRRTDDRVRRGVGMASLTWGAGGGPPAYATVRINRDGTIEVLTGAQDLGTGARTVIAQIAAEVLGARDRATCARSSATRSACRSRRTRGARSRRRRSVRRCASRPRRRATRSSRPPPACWIPTPSDLESRDSEIHAKTTDRCMLFSRRLREARRRDDHRPGEPRPESRQDGDRGVRRAVRRGRGRRRDGTRARAAHRRGARLRAHHQPDARREPARGRDHSRDWDTRCSRSACSTRARDSAQSDDARLQDSDDRATCRRSTRSSSTRADVVANHTGAKGLAEPPIIGVAPAIANAVADALGVEVTEIPLTPWRVGRTARQLDG